MKIPNFLLKKLYQKGSLRSAEGTTHFTIVNPISFDLLVGGDPLIIDGEAIPLDRVSFSNGEQTMTGAEVTADNYFKFVKKTPIEVTVADHTLSPGKHRVALKVTLKGAGDVAVTFDDATR